MATHPDKDLNILLLGETGVGKSTWINGFANYLSYSHLSQAEACPLISVIPMSFVIADQNFVERKIRTATEENESYQDGASCTQESTTYVFKVGDYQIRLIDTPGIGDTRGLEQDKHNFQLILNHISKLDKLHGICILLKPNNARITTIFQFCILELLRNLHVTACKNVVFYFTHCRCTHYRPGDTLTALREMLKRNEEFAIELTRDTIYCCDNDAIRCLAAMKQDVAFDDREKEEFSESWEISKNESERFLKYIDTLEPYDLKNTLSINYVRRRIESLLEPLFVVSYATLSNIVAIDKKIDSWSSMLSSVSCKSAKSNVEKHSSFTSVEIRIVPKPAPQLVCKNSECMKRETIGNSRAKYVYNCSPDASKNKYRMFVSILREWFYLRCENCNHFWSHHAEVLYDFEEVMLVHTFGKDENPKHRLELLQMEKHFLIDVGAKLSIFLKRHTLSTSTDVIDENFKRLIEIIKRQNTGKSDTLDSLKAMFEEYQDMVSTYDKNNADLTPEYVIEIIDGLYLMTHAGKMLTQIMPVAEETEHSTVKAREVFFDYIRASVTSSVNMKP